MEREEMTTIQNFNPKKCKSVKCPRFRVFGNGIEACFGKAEDCEQNKKWGYPKEINNGKM